ncbi:Uncharacterized protein dnm_018150 [Desulfonema magnum]|uniref:Uncharacterized protein n=1 Tax=Desulfonema magnum TaxID=45655 RepID=A0A975GLP0_9BACT|nr:Uncharacterized protein dnm_018150 [Desulfonema magnum]
MRDALLLNAVFGPVIELHLSTIRSAKILFLQLHKTSPFHNPECENFMFATAKIKFSHSG